MSDPKDTELGRRVEGEARKALARYRDRGTFAGSSEAAVLACWVEAVRPLVERTMELEEAVRDGAMLAVRHAKEREEHARIESALRAQIAGLEAMANGQEAAIADARADVRAEMAGELASTRSALERAVRRIARLETTITTLIEMAGKLEN